MDTTELTPKARSVFANDRFATSTVGIQIIAANPDHSAICEMQIGRQHLNARGAVMGGALFSLADFAAAVAANSDQVSAGEDLTWVSLNASVHYLAPAVGTDVLRAECKPLKTGRTTALYQTQIASPDNGHLIAIVETTMIHV